MGYRVYLASVTAYLPANQEIHWTILTRGQIIILTYLNIHGFIILEAMAISWVEYLYEYKQIFCVMIPKYDGKKEKILWASPFYIFTIFPSLFNILKSKCKKQISNKQTTNLRMIF